MSKPVATYRFEDGDCVPAVEAIDGSDPQRLVAMMSQAGLDPDDTDHPAAATAALIEAITREADAPGFVITPDALEKGEFTAAAVPSQY
jgi:hypothetical protein